MLYSVIEIRKEKESQRSYNLFNLFIVNAKQYVLSAVVGPVFFFIKNCIISAVEKYRQFTDNWSFKTKSFHTLNRVIPIILLVSLLFNSLTSICRKNQNRSVSRREDMIEVKRQPFFYRFLQQFVFLQYQTK